MVVDDSKVDRELIKALLERKGFRVTACASGAEAYESIQKSAPDLVVCDYHMPGMNGGDLLKKIRMESASRSLIFIVMTSEESSEIKVDLLKNGANDFLNKGTSADEIYARLGAHLLSRESVHAKAVLETAAKWSEQLNGPLGRLMIQSALLAERAKSLPASESADSIRKTLTETTQTLEQLKGVSDNLKNVSLFPERF